ncbi:EF hand domain-containing protein [Toxoplasma gondii TgCatPRC2]|uniref:EF hand domain-containing protein n=1 Tax=Toxoplasma gondii TgCatPRC2 TaxID=1130821 RepID=A0A151HEN8_TOXGO|nr:EF hand domain-containing protein [Toxoplasma gondii TgCatPRC2]
MQVSPGALCRSAVFLFPLLSLFCRTSSFARLAPPLAVEAAAAPQASASGKTAKDASPSTANLQPRTSADDEAAVHKVGREMDEDDEAFIREEFMEYDSNGDGMLDAYEVRVTHPEIGNSELFSFFRLVDSNQDGLLTLAEYREYVSSAI